MSNALPCRILLALSLLGAAAPASAAAPDPVATPGPGTGIVTAPAAESLTPAPPAGSVPPPAAGTVPAVSEPAAPDAKPAEDATDAQAPRRRRRRSDQAPPANQLDEVEVTAKKLTDTEQRRYSTAAKMVFGREELDKYGDTSVGEVLKRLPGVTVSGTPGRGGDIRMRGLGNGYTLILLNGEPMPRGFSLDQLSPEQVERIEIMRAPTAEHSTRAIAGIINIVLKEEIVRHSDELRPVLGEEGGRLQPQGSFQHSDGSGKMQYSFGINAFHRDLPSDQTVLTETTNTQSGAPVLHQFEQDTTLAASSGVNANARINWRLGDGDSFSLQPFVSLTRSESQTNSTLDQSVGATPPPFDIAHGGNDSLTRLARLLGNLKLGLGSGTRLELRFNLGTSNSDSTTTRSEFDSNNNPTHFITNIANIQDNSYSTAGKLSRPIGDGHQVAVGWEFEGGQRAETSATLQDGFNPLASVYGDQIRAHTFRMAGYAQDEWDINPLWSVYGGARWEEIRTDTSAQDVAADNTSVVLNPLLHSVWRFTEESKDQIRAALTTSYRAPTLGNLAPIPTLSSLYPASGTNTAASPDSLGNPNLKPELARGLDLAFEHYLARGGLLSVSVFQRDISNLIRNVVSLQTVSWSPVPRWVSSPVNFSQATARGVELEAKIQPSELIEGGSKNLDLRANYSHFWSQVAGIPGPDNRLDQQPQQTGNVGADYRIPATPLTVGGNFNWTPGFLVQTNVNQTYLQGSKRVLDMYGLWRIDGSAQLRVTLSNALHYNYATGDGQTFGPDQEVASTTAKTYPSISTRLEIRF